MTIHKNEKICFINHFFAQLILNLTEKDLGQV